MDSYNQKLLNDKPGSDVIAGRLNGHWHVDIAKARDCIECGQCESACTQHINIIERLKIIGGKSA
jgi:predicted aldo/keto reductase-like oxidoreductase